MNANRTNVKLFFHFIFCLIKMSLQDLGSGINKYKFISEAIKTCSAVIIGASNGLSISEGYNIFSPNGFFSDYFSDFRNKYGLRNILDGFFYDFQTEEEKWKFWSRLISLKCLEEQPSEMMKNLYKLVHDKDYFVITSNCEDHFIPAGFSKERVFEIEGKISEARCSKHCSEDIYSTKEIVEQIYRKENNFEISKELIPKCPRCHSNLEINVAHDQHFFSTNDFRKKSEQYQKFLSDHHQEKIVILELGVGYRNTMIKKPLMELVSREPNAIYITFNKGEIYIPNEISNKSIGIDEDISIALQKIISQ